MPRHYTDDSGSTWLVRQSSRTSEGRLYIEFENPKTGQKRGGQVGEYPHLEEVPDHALQKALTDGWVKCKRCGKLAAEGADLCYTHKWEEERLTVAPLSGQSVRTPRGPTRLGTVVAASLLALLVFVPVWILSALALNVFDLLRGNVSLPQRFFVEFVTAVIGGYAGVTSARRLIRNTSPRLIAAWFVAALIVGAVILVSVVKPSQMPIRAFDAIAVLLTVLGCASGAWFAARPT